MPSRLAAPLLTVDANKMHKIDPTNADNLFGMWMVFSRCAESLEEGRRLENLTWRLWNRETFCCEIHQPPAITPSFTTQMPPQTPQKDMPELSTSVDSVASDEPERIEGQVKASSSAPMDMKKPIIKKQYDLADSKSVSIQKHVTPSRLEKMIMHIQEKRQLIPLSPTTSTAIPSMTDACSSTAATTFPHRLSDSSAVSVPHNASSDSCRSKTQLADSDTSYSSAELQCPAAPTVVRGFSPGQPSSYRSHSNLATSTAVPVKGTVASKAEPPKKKGATFMLGGSSGDDESSFEERALDSRRSSLSEKLKALGQGKKHTSFKNEIESIKESHEDEGAIESDEGEVSESAIEDEDDASDWEDSVTESGASSPEDKELHFQRIDSTVNLRRNRRSLLTDLMHQPQRANAFANAAMRRSAQTLQCSRTSTPNGPSVAASPEDDAGLTMARLQSSSRPRPIIMTTSNTHPPALSPRTTRRNMLATELTESLRKHLLWERQQKSTTANAVLKRRHTSHDVAHLHDFPGRKMANTNNSSSTGSKNNSWNNYYFEHGLGEYHQRGW